MSVADEIPSFRMLNFLSFHPDAKIANWTSSNFSDTSKDIILKLNRGLGITRPLGIYACVRNRFDEQGSFVGLLMIVERFSSVNKLTKRAVSSNGK